MNIQENKYCFSAPNHNDGGQYSYSDSDYVTEGPDDRKVNSRRSQHSSPMPMYQQSYQRECESKISTRNVLPLPLSDSCLSYQSVEDHLQDSERDKLSLYLTIHVINYK